jgi:hypothetical protein
MDLDHRLSPPGQEIKANPIGLDWEDSIKRTNCQINYGAFKASSILLENPYGSIYAYLNGYNRLIENEFYCNPPYFILLNKAQTISRSK